MRIEEHVTVINTISTIDTGDGAEITIRERSIGAAVTQ